MILENVGGIEINKKEVYRYLGYKGATPNEEMAGLIDGCINDVVEVSEFRSFYQRYQLSFSDEEGVFSIIGATGDAARAAASGATGDAASTAASGGPGDASSGRVKIRSRALWQNLRGCREVFIFGATIGVGVDRLISRANVTNVAKAAIYQAVGAAYIEDYCDEINARLNELALEEGRKTKPRFSPGYGDFDIEYQREIFGLLNLTKHTGITLTEGMLMMPSKSVTALIGVEGDAAEAEPGIGGCKAEQMAAPERSDCDKAKDARHDCANCDMKDCEFRMPD